MKRILLGCLLLLALAGTGAADEGIRGRASFGGVLVEGLEVRAYPYRPGTFGPWTGERPAAAASTATDGTYVLPLPPGRYVVEGHLKAEGRSGAGPEPGDLYCLYAGSPVVVTPGAWTAVGLNLVRVPPETRGRGGRSRIEGRITFQGEPVERCYLYFYRDASTGFRGPAQRLQPVRTGSFRVRVPPGTYFLVARKRARGGPYGPIEIGDRFNLYPRNPVRVGPGEVVRLEIPLVERLSQLEEDPAAYRGLRVRVEGPDGAPRAGYYVLGYGTPDRTGPPLATSTPTGPSGETVVPLPPGTPAYLRARRSLGGPLGDGEAFGDAETAGGDGATVVIRVGRAP